MDTITQSPTSYWIAQGQHKLATKPLSGHIRVDVAVVGAGIFGVSTALRLIEEGKTVALIDQDRVGCGVTGFSTCKISSLHRLIYADLTKKHGEEAARTYGRINEAAIAEIDRNISRFNIECDYSRRDAVTFTLDDSFVSAIQDEVPAAVASGLAATYETETDLPFPVKAAVKVANQAQFNGYAYCVAIAQEFINLGGHVFERSRVTDVASVSPPHHVHTAEGVIEAGAVVIATHLPILDRSGHFGVCPPSASYSMAYRVAAGAVPPKGMYVTAESGHTRSIRTIENDTVLLVGGNSHPLGEPRNGSTEEEYQELDRWARANMPVGEFLARWSAEDYGSPDRLPYVGYLHRGTSSMYTATGFQKWGFTTAVAGAAIVADLIMEREPEGHTLLDARRWDISKGAVEMIKTGLHVTKHMVKDRVEHIVQPMDIEDLNVGCGAVCKYKGQTVAAYKDPQGQVHAVSPVCTHLGCHLVWNQGDRIWDCPCHGSRFDVAGKVLHGPAVRDLEQY